MLQEIELRVRINTILIKAVALVARRATAFFRIILFNPLNSVTLNLDTLYKGDSHVQKGYVCHRF